MIPLKPFKNFIQMRQMKTRDEIQAEAVAALKEHNGGTVHILTGGGKCKIAIDYILQTAKPNDTVIIAVPLTVLVTNWIKEFQKWTQCELKNSLITLTVITSNGSIDIIIDTIQSLYKVNMTTTFLIVDEIHTALSKEYSNILTNIKYKVVIGLTATLDITKRFDKENLYTQYCPVVFSYTEGESDGVVNKTKFVIINHYLTDEFRIMTGSKNKPFMIGEAKQYDYLSRQIKQGQQLMAMAGSDDFFTDASEWFWKKRGNKEQLTAGQKYLSAITNRRKFLLSLPSTAEVAKRLAKSIILENDSNKVLVFSELVAQIQKICKFNVYGEQDESTNSEILQAFNDGQIRAVGSCYSLTLGVNLVGANTAILESYQGSDTKATQRIGRLHRLATDNTATIYIIKVIGTQQEAWFNFMLRDYDLSNVEYIESSKILIN